MQTISTESWFPPNPDLQMMTECSGMLHIASPDAAKLRSSVLKVWTWWEKRSSSATFIYSQTIQCFQQGHSWEHRTKLDIRCCNTIIQKTQTQSFDCLCFGALRESFKFQGQCLLLPLVSLTRTMLSAINMFHIQRRSYYSLQVKKV